MFSLSRRPKRRIPKQFLAPRPMASPAQRQHPFWDLVPLEIVALVVCVATLLAAPLSRADAWLYEELLGVSGSNAPSEKVAVVLVGPTELRKRDCAESLPSLVARSRASAGILFQPLAGLCPESAGKPKLLALDPTAVRLNADGQVIGLDPGRDKARLLELFAGRSTEWIAPRPWRVVPTLSLEDLTTRRIPESLLGGRVVVFALAEPGGLRTDDAPLAAEVGAAFAAVLEDRPRSTLSAPARLAIGLVLLGAVSLARRRPRLRFAPAWLPWALGGSFVFATLAGAFGFGWLLPLPTLTLAVLVFLGVTDLPAALAARRARAGASRLLEEATQVGPHTSHLLPDSEFWNRMARRVEQTHAAEGVLVAELPPFSWRLRIWPNGDLNESIIRERRRDVRRTPYVDEAGGRRAKIVDGYVVMNGVPVVFAPLEAAGELEGFLILIGKPAAHAFVERPQATLRLADELALLIRNRRLERLRADEWRRPGGMLVENPGKWSETLLEKARTATQDLELLNDVFRSSPVGLLYADAFGDVRMLGAAFADLLKPLRLDLPEIGDRSALAPGRLSLSRLLADLAAVTGSTPPSLSDITTQGLSFDVPFEGSSDHLRIELKRIESGSELTGFLATLEMVRQAAPPDSKGEPIQRVPERGDPLVVFSLAELVTDTVSAIARDTRMKLRFQTPRVTGHAIGHRRELTDALVKFLLDAAQGQPGGQGPVITLRERRQWVELALIDLKLGVPEPAMERTVLAPSAPPPGLEPLARFIQAVEDSHGYVRVRGGTAWGAKLTVGLVRARPRFESNALGRLIRISEAPLGRRK